MDEGNGQARNNLHGLIPFVELSERQKLTLLGIVCVHKTTTTEISNVVWLSYLLSYAAFLNTVTSFSV